MRRHQRAKLPLSLPLHTPIQIYSEDCGCALLYICKMKIVKIIRGTAAFCAVLNLNLALAQTAAPAPSAAARPGPPARDPNTPGYVTAKELPDGAIPPPNADGNFIIGPTHNRAPEMTAHEGVPQGTVFDIHHEFGGQQDLSRHRARPGHLWHGGPRRPRQIGGDHQPSGSLHAPRGGLCPQAICPRHSRAFHRRRGRTRPGVVHGFG